MDSLRRAFAFLCQCLRTFLSAAVLIAIVGA